MRRVCIKGNINGSKTYLKNVQSHEETGKLKLNWIIMGNSSDWKRSQSLVTFCVSESGRGIFIYCW